MRLVSLFIYFAKYGLILMHSSTTSLFVCLIRGNLSNMICSSSYCNLVLIIGKDNGLSKVGLLFDLSKVKEVLSSFILLSK